MGYKKRREALSDVDHYNSNYRGDENHQGADSISSDMNNNKLRILNNYNMQALEDTIEKNRALFQTHVVYNNRHFSNGPSLNKEPHVVPASSGITEKNSSGHNHHDISDMIKHLSQDESVSSTSTNSMKT